ncbi:Down syndrome cell adhesion molecule-like protein Dscam2 [Folsomia candida]|uniref:Down syndrome cell adhesion molecule-like protein Dscam2 n=1 Tax=Folsomia candida TaxID=158441 RepID=A0A226DP40_FOLCA|nr:Down syndrome cell adhesion molecule-like protein Dscam2 [Folsomia candida]
MDLERLISDNLNLCCQPEIYAFSRFPLTSSDVHFGSLQCKLSNPSGTIISPEVVVRAVLDTPFHIENSDVTVILGNNAVLRCLVPPELVDYITVTSWVQDGSLNIYPNFQTGKWLLLPSGELHVFSVEESDGRKVWACRTLHKLTNEVMTSEGAKIVVKGFAIGAFYVVARDGIDILSRTAFFSEVRKVTKGYPHDRKAHGYGEAKAHGEAKVVLFKERVAQGFKKEPTEGPQAVRILGERETSLRVRAGEETYLSCHAEGNPPPSFSWYREIEGVLSDLPPTSKRPPSSPPNSVVHVAQVRPQDAGSYLCRANNSHSVDQAVIQLVVYVPLRVQVSPPTQIVDVGRSASLRCLVSGSPVHPVVWLKDGVPLAELANGPSSSPRFQVGPREVLKLVRIQPSDAGMYQCLASNDFTTGQDSSQIQLGSVLPELVYRFSEQTIQPGPSVSLKCTAVGNPPPQFTWTLDGFALPESERFLVGQYVTIHDHVISHVNITHARDEDGGLYACQARNAMGIALHTGRLNIYETWTEAEVEELAVLATQSTALVEGLTPSSTYHLRVLAQNGVGFSPPSEVVQITTTEEAPEGPPIKIVAEADSSTRLRVRWAPPERALWHGQILGYYLGYRELSLALADHPVLLSQEGGNEGVEMTGENGRSLLHSHLHGNLADLHGYHFKTVESEYTPYLGQRSTLDLSRATLGLSRSNTLLRQANVQSSDQKCTLATFPQKSYLASMTYLTSTGQALASIGQGLTSKGQGLTFDPSMVYIRTGEVGPDFGGETRIDNLRKFTRYGIVVQAFNAKGAGPSSSPTVATTLQDVPTQPPEKFECRSTSPQSLALTWEPPPLEARHGVVQGYKVDVLLVGGGDEGEPGSQAESGDQIQTNVTTERGLVLHGLRKWTNYSVTVRGFTVVGDGAVSTPILCRTDEDVSPPTPTNTVSV